MHKAGMRFLVSILFFISLAACSSGPQGQDPSAVKVDLTTDPAAAQATQKIKLIAHVKGLVKEEGTRVEYDIRQTSSGDPNIVTTVLGQPGEYVGETTFNKPGKYYVYVHVYQGDLHITKRKQLVVS